MANLQQPDENTVDLSRGGGIRLQLSWQHMVHVLITICAGLVLFTSLQSDVQTLKAQTAAAATSSKAVEDKLDELHRRLDVLNTRQLMMEQQVQLNTDRLWRQQGEPAPAPRPQRN